MTAMASEIFESIYHVTFHSSGHNHDIIGRAACSAACYDWRPRCRAAGSEAHGGADPDRDQQLEQLSSCTLVHVEYALEYVFS